MARTAKLSSACLLEGGLNRFSFVLFLFALFFSLLSVVVVWLPSMTERRKMEEMTNELAQR